MVLHAMTAKTFTFLRMKDTYIEKKLYWGLLSWWTRKFFFRIVRFYPSY